MAPGVKTGTSKDMRDNWCVGYTDRFTVGVWVGNASGEAMHDVSGISGAASTENGVPPNIGSVSSHPGHAGSTSGAPPWK